MKKFIITEISNGFILSGPRSSDEPTTIDAQIYLKEIYAVADVLGTWYVDGYRAAITKAKEKYAK